MAHVDIYEKMNGAAQPQHKGLALKRMELKHIRGVGGTPVLNMPNAMWETFSVETFFF